MDALPIVEATGLPYASREPGKMHACGHDGHTAILLAAAKAIADKPDFSGTLNLIFQPDEENLCGARAMIEDGLFERFPCDAIFALHNMPGVPAGSFRVLPGPVSLSSDVADVTIRGNLALLYAKRGDLKRAEAELLLATEVKPGFAIGYTNLGDVYRRLAEQAYTERCAAIRAIPAPARPAPAEP